MMKSEDTASFLYSLAKRGRKYYLGLSTITQDSGGLYEISLWSTYYYQLFYSITPETVSKYYRYFTKTFNLTDEEKYLLLESGVGEGIFFGLKHVAIKNSSILYRGSNNHLRPVSILSIKKEKDLESIEIKNS